jgi:hypothetical protein
LIYYLRMAILTFLAISVIGVFAFGYAYAQSAASAWMSRRRAMATRRKHARRVART